MGVEIRSLIVESLVRVFIIISMYRIVRFELRSAGQDRLIPNLY